MKASWLTCGFIRHFCSVVSVWDLLTCCPPPRTQRLSVNNLQKVVDFSECLELFFMLSLCPHLIRDHCEVHFCLGVPLTLAAVGVNILALDVLCSSLSDDLRLGSLPLPSSTYFQPLMLGSTTVSGVVSPTLFIAASLSVTCWPIEKDSEGLLPATGYCPHFSLLHCSAVTMRAALCSGVTHYKS